MKSYTSALLLDQNLESQINTALSTGFFQHSSMLFAASTLSYSIQEQQDELKLRIGINLVDTFADVTYRFDKYSTTEDLKGSIETSLKGKGLSEVQATYWVESKPLSDRN
jgi:hypothetical protein